MSSGTKNDHDQPLSEINVTPLVDVMLVLLVIFILLAPLITDALQLDLPNAQASPVQQPNVADLAIMPDGQLILDGENIARQQLVPVLQQRLTQAPDLVVQLKAEKMTHYQDLAEIMGLLKQAGIVRLAFAVNPA